MKKGFTVVEIMIVCAIILTLVAIAIPNLLRSRLNANEHHAISNLQVVSTAAQSFWSVGNQATSLPTDLAQLHTLGYVPDSSLACASQPCTKQGYRYTIGGDGSTSGFFVYTVPQSPRVSGVRSFCAGSDGVIRVSPSGATPASQAACSSWSPS